MLSCLVAVPLAAVFGTSLPEVASAILAGHWPGASDSADGALGDSPRFEPVMPGEMASMMPPRRMPAASIQGQQPLPASSLPAPWKGPQSDMADATRVVAAGYETPTDTGTAADFATEAPVSAAPVTVDRFTYIQNRLRQLGATY
ncbi:MAG TPA: hypothetical protein VE890_03805, partial [Thermoguttaceae bacterium]|nr:hypothetical protein [Thermoguttaceae bacterium]